MGYIPRDASTEGTRREFLGLPSWGSKKRSDFPREATGQRAMVPRLSTESGTEGEAG